MSAPAASASHDVHSRLYSLGWFSTTSLLGLLSSALEHPICLTRHYALASLVTGLRSPNVLLTGKLLLPIIIWLLYAFPYTVLRFDVNNHRGFSPVCLAITCCTNMNVVTCTSWFKYLSKVDLYWNNFCLRKTKCCDWLMDFAMCSKLFVQITRKITDFSTTHLQHGGLLNKI